jgi:hypothetical protein
MYCCHIRGNPRGRKNSENVGVNGEMFKGLEYLLEFEIDVSDI